MEILGNDIFLFKDSLKKDLSSFLYSIFTDVPINRDQFKEPLSSRYATLLNLHLEKAVEPEIHSYLLDLKHETRPDLLNYSGCLTTDVDFYNKNKKFSNSLKHNNRIQVEQVNARELHRGTLVYFGNFVEWKGHLNKFGVLINISEDRDHDTWLRFPIQKQEIKLWKNDIVVFPAGITHPTQIDIVNGKFKFIEGL